MYENFKKTFINPFVFHSLHRVLNKLFYILYCLTKFISTVSELRLG